MCVRSACDLSRLESLERACPGVEIPCLFLRRTATAGTMEFASADQDAHSRISNQVGMVLRQPPRFFCFTATARKLWRLWSLEARGALTVTRNCFACSQRPIVSVCPTCSTQCWPFTPRWLNQITAVYGEMLSRQPLRFLLADDPGAGKTIMTGLFIKELVARGDLQRCLIVCPGNLVEQWQDELDNKFHLLSRS
jgi:hypothetical protein